MEKIMPTAALAFIIAFMFAIVLTPIVRWICLRFSLQADPNPIIATHKVAKPTLGGVAVYLAFIITLAISFYPAGPGEQKFFILIVIGTFPIFLMGIYDDLKGLSFKFKGFVEILLIIVFILVFSLKPHFRVFPVFGYFLMMLWFVGIINAINLIDIMDGLASGIGLFVSLGFFILYALESKPELVPFATIAATLAGCYIAFLYYNFHPSKIFLGDNGSLIMGLVLAYLGFELVRHDPLSPRTMAPVIILAIPIFEVHLLILRRLKKKISVFKGSPDHLALVIQALGFSIPQTAVIIYVLSAILVCLGIWVWTTPSIYVQIAVSLIVVFSGIVLLRILRNVEVPE